MYQLNPSEIDALREKMKAAAQLADDFFRVKAAPGSQPCSQPAAAARSVPRQTVA